MIVSYTRTPPLFLLFIFVGVLNVLFCVGWWFASYFFPPLLVFLGVVSGPVRIVCWFWLDDDASCWCYGGSPCVVEFEWLYILLSCASFFLVPFLSLLLFFWPFCLLRTLCILSVGVRQLTLGPFLWKLFLRNFFHCVFFYKKRATLGSSHILCLNMSLCISISTCLTLAP